MCEIIDKNFEYTNKHNKIRDEKSDLKFNDYRDNDGEERTKRINKQLNKLPKHKKNTKTKS